MPSLAVRAVARPLRLPCHGLHARDAAREGLSRERGPLSQDRVLAGPELRVAERARRALCRLARSDRVDAPTRHRPAYRRRTARARTRAAANVAALVFDAAGRRS